MLIDINFLTTKMPIQDRIDIFLIVIVIISKLMIYCIKIYFKSQLLVWTLELLQIRREISAKIIYIVDIKLKIIVTSIMKILSEINKRNQDNKLFI